MFLESTLKRNPMLVKTAFDMHREGLLQPDTYILDLDTIMRNARYILREADKYGIKLYFMTKQFGRNPYIAKELIKLGYPGAVAVDYREAELLWQNGVTVCHAGHLVQVPSHQIRRLLDMNTEIITVYSVEKARQISEAARDLDRHQNIMLRVTANGDAMYPGQVGGIDIESLQEAFEYISNLPNVTVCGLTSFPCFLFDQQTDSIVETHNLNTVLRAKQLLEDKYAVKIKQINTPSATCTSLVKRIAELGGTHGEPGHGLLGTTPLHAVSEQVEIPAVVYISEISHNSGSVSYCYGGGHYRRSNMKAALIGYEMGNARKVEVEAPCTDNIDYYIGLNGGASVGETAVFAFRTQIFVTRSRVAVVKGISSGNPQIEGVFDSLGRPL